VERVDSSRPWSAESWRVVFRMYEANQENRVRVCSGFKISFDEKDHNSGKKLCCIPYKVLIHFRKNSKLISYD
jgi:hypothetical protein